MKHIQPTKKVSDKQLETRRSFLRKSVAIGGGVAGVTALSGEAQAAAETPSDEVKEEGYRLTDHVAEYYKSTRL